MTLAVRSTVEALAQRLRDEIAEGKLVPGQAIPQEEISARFGVSRSPLREALRQLEAEGAIEYRANRGAVVASIDAESLRQVYAIRRMLEAGAIELALPRIDAKSCAKLRKLDAALRAEKDARAFVKLHHEFHSSVYDFAGNALLSKAIHEHSIKVARIPDVRHIVKAIAACSKADHARLLEALEARDLRAALKVTREHLDHVETVMLSALKPD
jgi:DNA-binding GntR family transcriptional regulator